jgi:competence protein ComFC
MSAYSRYRKPQGVIGPWKSGIVLDWHTVDSKCVGENEFGHPIFETTRSELGELLFRFKYRHDATALQPLVEHTVKYLAKAKSRFDLLIPIPPSNMRRKFKPTVALARDVGKMLSLPVSLSAITKIGPTPELKTIADPEQRQRLLLSAFEADPRQLADKSILLVDDLYRSGATLAAATRVAYDRGKARAVYVFAVTRTRVNQ